MKITAILKASAVNLIKTITQTRNAKGKDIAGQKTMMEYKVMPYEKEHEFNIGKVVKMPSKLKRFGLDYV